MKTTATTNPVLQHHRLAPRAALALLLTAATACGTAVQPPGDLAASASQALSADNGFSPNGLNKNGLNKNGLNKNGLNMNGLNKNGLASPGFATWFDADAPTSDMVMSYVVKCAVPAGQTRTWQSPTTLVTYTWAGALGLLPGWAAGSAMTPAEQQVLTACLAAHVNKYGIHVMIAVEGRGATGVKIPVGPTELTDYSLKEAAFFGNLVQDEGIFVCRDHALNAAVSSPRACGLDAQNVGDASVCPPLLYVGQCSDVCVHSVGSAFYDSCTWNGKTYQPITTRLTMSERYFCGDGVCQFTEHCGTGISADSCKADCGVCP